MRNLPWDTTEAELGDIFVTWGPLTEVVVEKGNCEYLNPHALLVVWRGHHTTPHSYYSIRISCYCMCMYQSFKDRFKDRLGGKGTGGGWL